MKSPKAPDPAKTAQAQTQQNLSAAGAQQTMNMTNQVTPYGSLTYEQSGDMSYRDPGTGKMITVPRYTATQALSPAQQALFEQEQEFDRLNNEIALAQTGRIGEHLSTPFKYDPGEHEAWAGGIYDTLNRESNQRVMDQWDTKLKQQGLVPGSAAYDDAMRNVITSQARDRTAFMLDAYNTGLQTDLTERNQPINEITALISGGQVSQPTFGQTPTVNLQAPDVAGMTQNAYNQQVARQNAMLGGLSGLGGAAAGGWASGGFKTG